MATKSTFFKLECSQATWTFIVYKSDGWYEKNWQKQSAKQYLHLGLNIYNVYQIGLSKVYFMLMGIARESNLSKLRLPLSFGSQTFLIEGVAFEFWYFTINPHSQKKIGIGLTRQQLTGCRENLDSFRALKLSNLESFSVRKSSFRVLRVLGPETLQSGDGIYMDGSHLLPFQTDWLYFCFC